MRTNIDTDDRLTKQVVRYRGLQQREPPLNLPRSYVQRKSKNARLEASLGRLSNWRGDVDQSQWAALRNDSGLRRFICLVSYTLPNVAPVTVSLRRECDGGSVALPDLVLCEILHGSASQRYSLP